MFKIICVTNRRLCKENFLSRIEKIAVCRPSAIILREKDLSPEDYCELAVKILKICAENDVELILHKYFDVAIKLGVKKIHMPISELHNLKNKNFFDLTGASCHSVEELREIESFGGNYAVAGHIFKTDCKKNLEPRGINFLQKLLENSKIPIYAIGGIDSENISQIKAVGASGACIMSGFMICDDVSSFISKF